jgi:hypothetical protein
MHYNLDSLLATIRQRNLKESGERVGFYVADNNNMIRMQNICKVKLFFLKQMEVWHLDYSVFVSGEMLPLPL